MVKLCKFLLYTQTFAYRCLHIEEKSIYEHFDMYMLICRSFVGRNFKILLKIEIIYDNRNIDYSMEFLLKYKIFYSLFIVIKFTFFIYS